MTDCQHSSAAHQDAEEVYVLYRRDFYELRYPKLPFPGPRGCIQLIARKRRTGDVGTWDLPISFPSKWVGNRPREWRFTA